ASLPEEGQGFARLEEAMSACDVAKRCLGQLQDHATGKESLTEPELLKILDVLYSLKDPGSLSFMSDIPAVLATTGDLHDGPGLPAVSAGPPSSASNLG
ncbi:hypothetical protein WJX84_007019, partial [Apatococcus fuscideae]